MLSRDNMGGLNVFFSNLPTWLKSNPPSNIFKLNLTTPIGFLQFKNTEEEEWSSKMLEVCSQNSDIDFGYQLGDPNLSIKIQLGDPNLSVKIGRFSCEISEEGYSRTLDSKDCVLV